MQLQRLKTIDSPSSPCPATRMDRFDTGAGGSSTAQRVDAVVTKRSVVCECSGAVSRTMLGLLVMSAAVAMTAAQLQQLKKQNRPPVSAPSRLHCLTPESSLSPRTSSEF
ncbi:hypothetical protein F2P79_020684 [Pimephales promelas]|nr:hypothetical protein F2P79_020684 [Pimephales promelas]